MSYDLDGINGQSVFTFHAGIDKSRPTGGIGKKKLIQLIEYQDFRCALTGVELTPEIAAADHICPTSKGGEHSMQNIQIVHKDVNRMKGALDQDEFIRLCGMVVAHAHANSPPPPPEPTTRRHVYYHRAN